MVQSKSHQCSDQSGNNKSSHQSNMLIFKTSTNKHGTIYPKNLNSFNLSNMAFYTIIYKKEIVQLAIKYKIWI